MFALHTLHLAFDLLFTLTVKKLQIALDLLFVLVAIFVLKFIYLCSDGPSEPFVYCFKIHTCFDCLKLKSGTENENGSVHTAH
jgi:hypothetical protein